MSDSSRSSEEKPGTPQADVSEWNLQRLGSDIDPIHESFAKLNGLMTRAFAGASSSKWPEHGVSIAMLFGWAFGRLVNAYRLVLDGYFCDSAMLLRAAWEAKWQLFAFDIEASQVSPEADSKISRWTAGEWIGQGKVRQMFSAPNVLTDHYSELSALTHPGNIRAVRLQVEETTDANGITLGQRLGGIKNATVTDTILSVIWQETLDLIGYVPLAFPETVDDPDSLHKWHEGMMSRRREFGDRRLPSVDGQL